MRGSFVSKWSHWKPCTEGRHNLNLDKSLSVYSHPKRTEYTFSSSKLQIEVVWKCIVYAFGIFTFVINRL